MKKKDSREDWFWSFLLGATLFAFLGIGFILRKNLFLMAICFVIADILVMVGAFINRKE